MTSAQDSLSFGLTSLMLIGIVLLPWVTLALSEVLLAFYRHAVVRSMGGALPLRAEPAAAVPEADPWPGAVELAVQQADEVASNVWGHSNVPYAEYQRATRSVTLVYVAAGFAYAAVMALALGLRFDALAPVTLLFLTISFAWPVVLTALLLAGWRRRWQTLSVAGYLALALTANAAPMPDGALLAIFMANVGATIVALVVRSRRIRAVAPLVGAFLSLFGVGLLFGMGLAAAMGRRTEGAADVPGGLESFVFLLLVIVLVAAGPVAGWLTLRWLAHWYAQKRTSDQAITMAAIWLIFAAVHATTFAYDDVRWMAIGLVAFAVFLAATTVGFRRVRRESGRRTGPRLLVLRVFALGRRSRRLFDHLATRWRFIGSVQLIAGPDLATSTVEPHEFMDFVRRRLGSRFLETGDSIDAALAELDVAPDHDGRFRITDFFCRDSAWRNVFGRLAARSDVVLMDLRGFSHGNSGCAYELGELLNVVPVERVAVVIDRFTDEAFLTRTVAAACARLAATSPNRHASAVRVQVFRETGRRGLDPDRLLRLLCEAAARRGEVVGVG
jgi:hypothetical protein